MQLSAPGRRLARFGLFEADFEQRRLTKSGLRIKLQDQPFLVLTLLLEQPGEVVTRDEIRRKVWSADTFVEFDDGLNTAIKKLRLALSDSSDNPRFIETVPRRGYRFLAPVIFSAPPDVVDSRKPTEPMIETVVVAAQERSRIVVDQPMPWRGRYWIAIALVLLLAGAVLYRFRSPSQRSLEPSKATSVVSDVRPRRSVAVLGFRNLPGRASEDWLSLAFSQMLSTELAAGGDLRLISGEDVAHAKRELPLADADSLARGTLERLRANLGADVVVLGSYTPLREKGRNRIRLDVRLQDTSAGDTSAGDTIAEEAFTGGKDELLQLVSQ